MNLLGVLGMEFAHLSQAATGSLVAAVWQGVLLAAAAGLGLRLLPRTPAAVRFAIWFGVFLVVAALPLISLSPYAAGPAQAGGHAPWFLLDARWCLAIAAVWAVASFVRVGTLAVAAFRVRALWRRATPVDLQIANSGTGRRASLCTSDQVDRPTVIGFFSPKILIPEWLLEKLTPAELEQIVLHESGHLRRADDWMNLLQKIALVIFPLNPALAWIERRLCFERELAVDERVLHAFAGRPGAATAYASCLTTLAEYRLGFVARRRLALVLGALGRESQLARRVGRILRGGERMKPLHAKFVLGGAMLGLLIAAAGLERCPQLVGFTAPGTDRAARTEQAAQKTPAAEAGAANEYGYHAVALRVAAVSTQPWMTARTISIKIAHNNYSKSYSSNDIQPNLDAVHEVLLKTSIPGGQQDSAAGSHPALTAQQTANRQTANRNLAQPVTLLRTVAQAGAPHSQPAQDSEVTQPGAVFTRWVVVTTSWRADGSRVVVRDYSSSPVESESVPESDSGAPSDAQSNPQADSQPAPTQQVHRYAAMPVQGGWLIFQL